MRSGTYTDNNDDTKVLKSILTLMLLIFLNYIIDDKHKRINDKSNNGNERDDNDFMNQNI